MPNRSQKPESSKEMYKGESRDLQTAGAALLYPSSKSPRTPSKIGVGDRRIRPKGSLTEQKWQQAIDENLNLKSAHGAD